MVVSLTLLTSESHFYILGVCQRQSFQVRKMSSEIKVMIWQVPLFGHLSCGLQGVISPCSCWYLCTLGRMLLYVCLVQVWTWFWVGVGEDTDVRLNHSFLPPSPFVDVVLVPLHLYVMAWYLILLSYLNELWSGYCDCAFDMWPFCGLSLKLYYYSIYIVNLLMLLWMCVWLWMFNTMPHSMCVYILLDTWQ